MRVRFRLASCPVPALPLVLLLLVVLVLLAPARASAQVTDSQRAAARDLFKEGDALQRAGKLAEALDKFQRAQAVFDAPTNLLRIAECEAALGRLVESAEAFRAVLRAQLQAGSPPAFQAAVDQARAELAQVEPRVPKVEVDVQPAKVANLQLQIDGQNVSAALVGEVMPLDPGTHKVVVSAPGYAPAEQQVALKESESKTVAIALKAAPASAPAVGAGGVAEASAGTASGASDGAMPPPPPVVEAPPGPPPKSNRPALLLGAHLGWDFPSGQVPIDGTNVSTKDLGGSGPAIGLDGGIRFAHQWYAGLTLEHAEFGSANVNGGDIPPALGVTKASSNTTVVGAVLGLIVNPARPSFYGNVGLAGRWYTVTFDGADSPPPYFSGEVNLTAGVWIPSGKHFVVVPEASVNVGAFSSQSTGAVTGTATDSSSTPGHVFVLLGVAGFYSADL